jgi:hypothetical protein
MQERRTQRRFSTSDTLLDPHSERYHRMLDLSMNLQKWWRELRDTHTSADQQVADDRTEELHTLINKAQNELNRLYATPPEEFD